MGIPVRPAEVTVEHLNASMKSLLRKKFSADKIKEINELADFTILGGSTTTAVEIMAEYCMIWSVPTPNGSMLMEPKEMVDYVFKLYI